jgi:hypothetical protein
LPLADFSAIRSRSLKPPSTTSSSAIVGGALREYLASKGELPDESLLAMVPMTLRGSDKGGDRGNQVGATAISVHTEIEDPVQRLRAIRKKAATSKRLTDKLGKELMRDLLDNLPNLLASPLGRHMKLPKIGLVVSNVRGPDVPLYLAGAQLVNYAPISIAVDRMGLNVTGFSYAGTMWICAVSCREMLPDPGYFAECLRNAFAALKDAAARNARGPRPRRTSKAARPRRAESGVESAVARHGSSGRTTS